MSTFEVSSGLPEGDPDAARSTDSSGIAPSEDGPKPDGCDPVVIDVPLLVVKLPSNVGQEFKVHGYGEEEDDEAGFKTPTSADSKIPALAECPPAPRKRRSEAVLNLKTPPEGRLKCRRLLFDLSGVTQSFFAPPLSTNFGGEINLRPKDGDAAPAREV